MRNPTISELIHHIKNCPVEILNKPIHNGAGDVNTEALVNDLFRFISGNPTTPKMVTLEEYNLSLESKSLIQIAVWLLSFPFFQSVALFRINTFLFGELPKLSNLIKTEQWIEDEERAEELARLALIKFNITPNGETISESQDRFDAVDTIKRLKVIEESRAAFERAQKIRQKMAEKRAREAANVYARE